MRCVNANQKTNHTPHGEGGNQTEIEISKYYKHALAFLSYKKPYAPTWWTVPYWQAAATHSLLTVCICLRLQISPHGATQNHTELLPTTLGDRTRSHDLANSSSSPQRSGRATQLYQYTLPSLVTRALKLPIRLLSFDIPGKYQNSFQWFGKWHTECPEEK